MTERRKFDKAFKEQVVTRIISNETTICKMTEELCLHYTTVRDWVRNYEANGENVFPRSANLKPEDEEIRRLRRQPADLKKENEILKKAAAYVCEKSEISS